MRVAFYAPLKAPDHPVPSGDRQMARLLMAALRLAGHQAEVVSRLRSFISTPDLDGQARIEAAAAREADTIAARWSTSGLPDLWFTYHNHYKAPDLLGVRLAQACGLPLVMAEASHAPKRAALWRAWHTAAETATRAAQLHFCFTRRDRAGIADLLRPGARLVDLPPFIDGAAWPPPDRGSAPDGQVRLVTIAMMRHGDKLNSYRFLAASLHHLLDRDWSLTIVGDGNARPEVEAAFAGIPASRLQWRGALSAQGVAEALGQSDVFVWPGFGEAFGLAYLEAQALGLPAVALDVAGVASVIRSGETGVLVERPQPSDYASALRRLCDNSKERQMMGQAAAAWVRRERTLDRAAQTIRHAIGRLLPGELVDG